MALKSSIESDSDIIITDYGKTVIRPALHYGRHVKNGRCGYPLYGPASATLNANLAGRPARSLSYPSQRGAGSPKRLKVTQFGVERLRQSRLRVPVQGLLTISSTEVDNSWAHSDVTATTQ